MNAIGIIQARMDSSRLPGKMLMPLYDGRSALEIMLARLRYSHLVSKFVVATTADATDDGLAALCERLDIPCYRGSPNDVLDRYYSAYLAHGPADAVVRLTGDCPMHDAALVDAVVEKLYAEKADYASNTISPSYPDGLDVEAFTPDLLETMWREAQLPSEREHVTQFFYHNRERFRSVSLSNDTDLSGKRWTLDYPEDLEFIQTSFKEMGGIEWGWRELLAVLERRPELEKINAEHSRNDGLKKSETEDALCVAGSEVPPWDGKGQDLYRHAKQLIPGGTQLLSKRPEMYLPNGWPAYFSKAKGAEVWDLDGRHYFDFTNMSVGACPLGYGDPDVDAAVREAVARGNMSTLNAPEEVELAELLLEIHPWAQNVRYARGGGDGMAVAVRIARATTGRDKVAVCGYSGWHDWYLAVNIADASGLDGHHLPGLDPTGTPRALRNSAMTFQSGDLSALEDILLRHGDEVAAVVMEPLRNAMPPRGYLERIKELAHARGALLVFDEVSSGFRICCGGAHLALGMNPDIAVLSKGISNGYPMAAVFGTSDAMSGTEKSFISSTYWTDRIGPAAALACIRKYRALKVHLHQKKIGEMLLSGWEALGRKCGFPIVSGGIPALAHFGIDSAEGLEARTLFTKLMLGKGYLAGPGVYPTWAHDAVMVEQYLARMEEVFAEIIQAGNAQSIKSVLHPSTPAHTGFKRLN